MTRATKPAAPELVTVWIPCTTPPVRKGSYQVRNSEIGVHWKHKLVGANDRYWDGKRWLVEKGGHPSICGSHRTHQWRGVRRWVLQAPSSNLMGAIAGLISGKEVVIYLEDARPRSAKWNSLAKARPFKTEAEAQRFAARYSRLALTAVLP